MAFIPPPINTKMMDGNQLSMIWRRWFHDLYTQVDFVAQDVSESASPTFIGLTLAGLASSRLVTTGSAKELKSVTNLADFIAGTSSQINIKNDGDGTITISTPQDINTLASPTFAGLTLSNLTASRLMQSDGLKSTTSVANLAAWISGAVDDGDGTVTIDHGLTSGTSDDDHTQYHTDARAATWLASNHETTYTHADIATNSTHRTTTTGNPHSVSSSDLVASGTPQSGTYTFGGGTTGDVASMTFSNGILTTVTTVP